VAGRAGTLLLLDVDHFKRVNDTYGHAIGDLCLQAMGRKLMDTVRNHDPVARIGGEEFAVFLTDTPRDQALLIGQRLTSALEVEARAQGVRLSITTSVGATDVPPGGAIDQMFRQADDALYHAKERGRARMVFFDPEERRLSV
jgi:diguanylate cyclase